MNSARVLITTGFLITAVNAAADEPRHDEHFSERDLRGTWTYSSEFETTLPIPFAADIVDAAPPPATVYPGDVVTIKGTTVGLFEFDGRGGVVFRDFFKAGTVKPLAFPSTPAAPEDGYGTYSVERDGFVHIQTVYLSGDHIVGESDYVCTISTEPRQLDCMWARFKTFVVDANGYDAPIEGLVTMRPQTGVQ